LSRDADRFLERERHGIVGDGIHIADDFGGQSAVVFETSSHVVDIVLSFDDGLAGVAAFQFGERRQVLANFVGEAEKDATSLLRGCRRPWALFESGLGGGDGAVHVVGRGVGNLRDHFFGRGIVNRESLRRLARDPFSVDEHLISLDFGLNSAGHCFADLLLTQGVVALSFSA
jgi:hypothetical protein